MNSTQIAKMIDHTILKATTTKEDVVKICKEAKEYGFFSVCINPANIELAKEELKGSNVKVCTVIGFPLGANTSAVKAFETKDAIAKGILPNVNKVAPLTQAIILLIVTKFGIFFFISFIYPPKNYTLII